MPLPSLDELRAALTARYGRLDPALGTEAADAFEALVSTLLDRAFDEPKRRRAVDALRDNGLLEPQALAEADPAELGEALRSAGLKVQDKALVPLRRVARWLVEVHHGDADALADRDASSAATEQLREELTAINGVGPATADALLLHALNRPAYPVDRGSYRIFVRHGWIDPTADYDEARDTFERLAPDDPAALVLLSAGLDRVARDACRLAVAKCDKCPLRPFLPESGPIDPTG